MQRARRALPFLLESDPPFAPRVCWQAQLHLIADLYTLVLRPCYYLARLHESSGGGRYMAKNRTLRIELFRRVQARGVQQLSCWAEVEKAAAAAATAAKLLGEDAEEASKLSSDMFLHAADRILECSIAKSVPVFLSPSSL